VFCVLCSLDEDVNVNGKSVKPTAHEGFGRGERRGRDIVYAFIVAYD